MKTETRRLGLFDWLVLTLVAALAAVGAFGFLKYGEKTAPAVEIECVLRFQSDEKTPAVAVGDEVRSENGTVLFGKVSALSSHPYQTVFLRNGTPVYDAVEGLTEVDLTVRMLATKADDYRVGDIRMSAGVGGTFRIGGALVPGVRILTLTEVKENEK